MVEHEPYSGLLFLGFERLSRQNNAFYNDPVGVDGQNTAGGDEREGTAGHEAEDEDRGGGEKNGTVARSHRSDSFLEETLVFEFVPLKRVLAKYGTKRNPPCANEENQRLFATHHVPCSSHSFQAKVDNGNPVFMPQKAVQNKCTRSKFLLQLLQLRRGDGRNSNRNILPVPAQK